MPTLEAKTESKTIELPGIPLLDWSCFEDPEIVLIKALLERGGHENVAALINNMTPEKEAVISSLQAALRPDTFLFQSRRQQEFEQWMATHPSELTPEIEREWQARIESEKREHLQRLSGDSMIDKVEMNTKGGSKTATGLVTNNLADLPDLPSASREKLNALGVTSISQFKAMGYKEKVEALGPKVASRFKDFSTPLPTA